MNKKAVIVIKKYSEAQSAGDPVKYEKLVKLNKKTYLELDHTTRGKILKVMQDELDDLKHGLKRI
jgi:hypothetical protein